MARYDANVEGVRSVFLKLRTRSGLTVERLDATEVDVRLLAELPVVRRRVRETGEPEGEAIVHVVTAAVAALDPTDLLIADAALALGVLRERVGARRAVEGLYADDLGERRRALAEGWVALHELLGVTSDYPAPTVRSLRGSIETRTLGVLADRCVHDVEPVEVPAGETVGTVVVVGGATTDHVVVADGWPDVGKAVQAQSFDVNPGGKGLNLAVASRRLGLEALLVAAVGGDSQARDLVEYLRGEGLSTQLVKETPGAANPQALVLVDPTGAGPVPRLDERIRSLSVQRGPSSAGACGPRWPRRTRCCVTLEPPMETIKWALSAAATQPKKPLVLLQASPSREAPQQLYRLLRGVDYVVGREGELRALLSDPDSPRTVDELARSLLALGVGAVCVVESFGCRIRSSVISQDIEGPPVPLDDAPGVREAFSAALIQKLIQEGAGRSREQALNWAIAAMAANPTLDEIAGSMPVLDEVERTLETDESLENP